ncbi:hypothetical protein EV641_11178 [Rhodococcus sp. SMB37]|nr:hypothetical protein EV641_11178 [Rhodococcus sp. SMB37]
MCHSQGTHLVFSTANIAVENTKDQVGLEEGEHQGNYTAGDAFLFQDGIDRLLNADGCAGEVGASFSNSIIRSPISWSFLRPNASRTFGNHSCSSSSI